MVQAAGLVLSALVLQVTIGLSLAIVPFKFVMMLVNRLAARRDGRTHARDRIVWAVAFASRRLPLCRSCLVQALVGRVLLQRNRWDAQLWLGVRKRGGELHGHAWLVSEGDVIVGEAWHEAGMNVA